MKKFTLIELMIVIGILAILLTILLPSLKNAREAAKTAVCNSQLSSLNKGLQLHLKENQYHYMERDLRHSRDDGGNFWTHQLKPYYGDQDSLKCPSASHEVPRTHMFFGNAKKGWGAHGEEGLNFVHLKEGVTTSGSYGMNGFLYKKFGEGGDVEAGDNDGIEFYQHAYDIENPDNTPHFSDMKWVDAWPRHGDQNPDNMQGNADPTNQLGRVFLDRHYRKKINVTFADGSAKTIQTTNVLYLDWNKQELYRPVW